MFSCVVRVVFVCLCSVLCALCSLCSVRGLFVCLVLCFSKNVSEGCEKRGPEAPRSTPEAPKSTPGGSKIHPGGPGVDPGGPGGSERALLEPALPPHGAQRDPKWSIWGPFWGHFRCIIGLKKSFLLSIPFWGAFWTILESILEELEVDF